MVMQDKKHGASWRGWVPAEIVRLGLDLSGLGVRFRGDFASWEEAEGRAEGYVAGEILEQVRAATLKVKNGMAAYERDGVLFSQAEYPFPLLAGLLRAAALDEGRLDVVDFGGALGSTYFQCRRFIEHLPFLRWRVVEQPHFVACGREHIADGTLAFAETLEECFAAGRPNVAVISGVLQYLPDPDAIMQKIIGMGIPHLIIDRTPAIQNDHEIISLQIVPGRIVRSSYPVRLFTRESLLRLVGNDYKLVAEFGAIDGVLGGLLRRVEFKGFIMERDIA